MAGVGAKGKARAIHSAARPSRKIPKDLRKALTAEAGGKCANPGCPNWRTEVHHIREWHVYKTHDQRQMVAVCPTCHDLIHNGLLKISDEVIYQWKAIRRPEEPVNTHLYVEPGGPPALLVGSVLTRTTTGQGMTYFRTPNGTRLGTRTHGEDVLELELVLCDSEGRKLLEVAAGNHVRLRESDDIEVRTRPGSFEVWTPLDKRFLPSWLPKLLLASDPQFIVQQKVMLAAATVARPSVVQIRGIWPTSPHMALVIDEEWVSFYDQFVIGSPSRFRGERGKDIKMIFDGDVSLTDSSCFLAGLQLDMGLIFGKRNYSAFVPPFSLLFKDQSLVGLSPPSVDINAVVVHGPKDSTADFFKRFLVRLELLSGVAYRCHFQDGSTVTLQEASSTR